MRNLSEKVSVILENNTPLSMCWKNRDYKIKYLTFFYNEINQKFQLLSMYQPPLVLILLLIYIFDVFLMIGI